MKLRKRRNVSEESYWKSSTDIMAGVLLVILLVVMLLLLYLTQLPTEELTHTADYETVAETHIDDDPDNDHDYDHLNDNPPENDDGGGGGGGGEDDPGTAEPVEVKPDQGNDKTAVFVTVVDEETGNAIKKEGILFELYNEKGHSGGLQTLHTYYPKKTEYKQYKTISDGTFYLPEKISQGWYSLHNLTAPEGYGVADDFEFEITESLDWSDPYYVEVPMSPSKNRIYVRNVDASTKEAIPNVIYNVYAAEDITTLDGTLRFQSGEKVDTIKCDKTGNGASKKLYLGKYYISQIKTDTYYALNQASIDVDLKLTDTEKNASVVECEKTRIKISLKDEYTEEPVTGAVYSVTDKENVTTNDDGIIAVSDLKKDTAYTVTLESVPEPYRISSEPVTLKVDKDGYISGEPSYSATQTAYVIRLEVNVKDMIFKNSVSSASFALYNSSDDLVDEWDAVGETHLIEGLEPGVYTMVTNDNTSSGLQINVKDIGTLQKSESQMWTLWDTILVVASVIVLALIIYIIIRIARSRRKKANDHQKDSIKEK